ncbi:MAG TPA: nuclear transport factor 2 family protein [Pyrinomonadaceae bacterium]|nr:nuclear transport factor 2 family protein [Pyrinomonadaceae bacterium]
MKRCHVCQRTYPDDTQFCLQDGAPLLEEPAAPPRAASAQTPPGGQYEPPRGFQAGATPGGGGPPPPPGYPGGPQRQSAAPPRKRKIWPWVLGGVVVVGFGLGVVALVIGLVIMKGRSNTADTVNVNASANARVRRGTNSGPVAPNANGRDTGDDAGASSTSDRRAVMAELSKVENDWIRANIKADKEALDQILAEEYTGTMHDGTTQTKDEYLADIKPDRTARSWSSEDVKLELEGDTAILSGVLIWNSTSGTRRFRFTDTFVKRDGRWQAVASETAPADDDQ